jgi:hypothetical protein
MHEFSFLVSDGGGTDISPLTFAVYFVVSHQKDETDSSNEIPSKTS